MCHQCDNPSCVNPDHLFLGTHKDNVRDMLEKGRSYDRAAVMRGKRRAAKLTQDDVRAIRRLAAEGVHPRRLAHMYGVCVVNIRCVINRKTWVSVDPLPDIS